MFKFYTQQIATRMRKLVAEFSNFLSVMLWISMHSITVHKLVRSNIFCKQNLFDNIKTSILQIAVYVLMEIIILQLFELMHAFLNTIHHFSQLRLFKHSRKWSFRSGTTSFMTHWYKVKILVRFRPISHIGTSLFAIVLRQLLR